MPASKLPDHIEVIGGKVNNLKNINVNIPLHKFVAVSGLSGSGKSSLAWAFCIQKVPAAIWILWPPTPGDGLAKLAGPMLTRLSIFHLPWHCGSDQLFPVPARPLAQ